MMAGAPSIAATVAFGVAKAGVPVALGMGVGVRVGVGVNVGVSVHLGGRVQAGGISVGATPGTETAVGAEMSC